MTSERQIAANRRNAQKSTGPRSAAGKMRSRLNARRHGLTAVLPEPADRALLGEIERVLQAETGAQPGAALPRAAAAAILRHRRASACRAAPPLAPEDGAEPAAGGAAATAADPLDESAAPAPGGLAAALAERYATALRKGRDALVKELLAGPAPPSEPAESGAVNGGGAHDEGGTHGR
ncbi:hypothetical protein ABEG18_06040 [Alsobacter sp. KACC 23698]|uniref:Uncharacterized protein n=1 Tax=Alsobacter sp. KACC 23698 TaxID=3149229 RepID=A0AAU7JIX1_9HYPH